MFKYFFEDPEYDTISAIKDKSYLFNGLKITQAGDKYLAHMGKYPVINLSLKCAKQDKFEIAHALIKNCIEKEYGRHRYILTGTALDDATKKQYELIYRGEADESAYCTSLQFLSECLYAYHQQKVIILIDEYDELIEAAYFSDFYDQLIDFIDSLFLSALKTNIALEFAVIVGCLRISRESTFTGLSNLRVISIMDREYSEYFGFIQKEIDVMLGFYNRSNKAELAKEWYNGYKFGDTEAYNPYSIIKFMQDLAIDENALAKSYWGDVGSNDIVKILTTKTEDPEIIQDLEDLIAGKTIEKPVHEEIIYADIDKNLDNLWNFLFFTGYLKKTGERQEGGDILISLALSNREIRYIYKNTIKYWFEEKLKVADLSKLHQAVLSGDDKNFTTELNKYLLENISYYDSSESLYHGFLLGLLARIQNYGLGSNREAGKGRYDILIKPCGGRELAIIIELKVAPKYAELEEHCDIALAQINAQSYESELREDCYKKILKYGIAFNKKDCLVKLG